jgi:hypothetical protein
MSRDMIFGMTRSNIWVENDAADRASSPERWASWFVIIPIRTNETPYDHATTD